MKANSACGPPVELPTASSLGRINEGCLSDIVSGTAGAGAGVLAVAGAGVLAVTGAGVLAVAGAGVLAAGAVAVLVLADAIVRARPNALTLVTNSRLKSVDDIPAIADGFGM